MHLNTHKERQLSGTALQLNNALSHMKISEKAEDLGNSIYIFLTHFSVTLRSSSIISAKKSNFRVFN